MVGSLVNPQCPHCKNDHPKMIEKLGESNIKIAYMCEVCSKYWWVIKKENDDDESKRGRS